MQIASIPQKALSPLLSRCGSSNRYPVRPVEKKHGKEGGNPVSCGKCNNSTGDYGANVSDYEDRSLFFGQRVSSCPFTSSMYLRKDKAGDSEPKGPFCRLHGRSV